MFIIFAAVHFVGGLVFCLFAKSKLEPWAKGSGEQVNQEAAKSDAVGNMIASFESQEGKVHLEQIPVTVSSSAELADKLSIRSHKKQTRDTGVQATDLNEVKEHHHHF